MNIQASKHLFSELFATLTAISFHVAVNWERISVPHGVDPVLPVSPGVASVSDVLTGMAGTRGRRAEKALI